jgi:hypothetical protein
MGIASKRNGHGAVPFFYSLSPSGSASGKRGACPRQQVPPSPLFAEVELALDLAKPEGAGGRTKPGSLFYPSRLFSEDRLNLFLGQNGANLLVRLNKLADAG